MYKIQTLNKISSKGLNHFPLDNYEVASDINNPDAILVRSQDMHGMELSESVKAIARAGAGTNNIPIAELSEKVWPKIEEGEMKPSLYKVLPLEEANEALDILERGENIGKVVLRVCDE